MKALECKPVSLLIAIILAYGLCQFAIADIYTCAISTETVNLSNVPTGSGCSVMVQGPTGQGSLPPLATTAVPPETAIGNPPLLNISDKAIYDNMVDEIARAYGVESALLHAVISVESRYSPTAVSRTGAIGLMQLMPVTARRYGVTDPFDPVQNLQGGARYLSYLLRKYNNDKRLALAAYNAGEGAIAKYGNQIPPYRETTNYVPRVMGYYRKYRKVSKKVGARQSIPLTGG